MTSEDGLLEGTKLRPGPLGTLAFESLVLQISLTALKPQ